MLDTVKPDNNKNNTVVSFVVIDEPLAHAEPIVPTDLTSEHRPELIKY